MNHSGYDDNITVIWINQHC